MKSDSYDQFFKNARKAKQGGTALPPLPREGSAKTHSMRRQNLKIKPKPRAPFPRQAIFGLGFTAVFALTYSFYPDFFASWLDRIEIRAIGSALAADIDSAAKADPKAAEKSKSAGKDGEKTAASNDLSDKGKTVAVKSGSSEELGHFENLRKRKEELDAREKDLGELEEELQRQKVELDRRISQLEEMRSQISQTLKDRVELDQEKVGKLVDLYSNMKPKQAADIMSGINEDLAVEVLAKMKKKNAAEIMNLLSSDKARILSERYTGYRRPASSGTGGAPSGRAGGSGSGNGSGSGG